MDRSPAQAVRNERRSPTLSVIIPAYNGGEDLRRCLRRLRASTHKPDQILVVDDGSTDQTAEIATSFGAILLSNPSPRGPAAARNTGARMAQGEILLFLDADVLIHPGAMAQILERFRLDSRLAAVFGSYDDQPKAPGIVSQFRNLLHHFVHQDGPFGDSHSRPVKTFWTGLGAVRAQVFKSLGGFDPQLYTRPAIEDIEFGYRLHSAGYRAELDRSIQGTHLKRWTLGSMIRTDILCRGIPWLILQWRMGHVEQDLNVKRSQKLSVIVVGLSLLVMPLVIGFPVLGSLFPFFGLALVLLNFRFYRFLTIRHGLIRAVASLPIHAIYFFSCGISVVAAAGLWWRLLRADQSNQPDQPSCSTDRQIPYRVDPGEPRSIKRPSLGTIRGSRTRSSS